MINKLILSVSWLNVTVKSGDFLETKDLNIFTSSTEYTEFNKMGGVKMPNITLSIPEDLKKRMDAMPEIKWSEVTREFLSEKVKRLFLLKKLDESLKNSKLTDEDCLRLGKKIKERMWKKYKKEGW